MVNEYVWSLPRGRPAVFCTCEIKRVEVCAPIWSTHDFQKCLFWFIFHLYRCTLIGDSNLLHCTQIYCFIANRMPHYMIINYLILYFVSCTWCKNMFQIKPIIIMTFIICVLIFCAVAVSVETSVNETCLVIKDFQTQRAVGHKCLSHHHILSGKYVMPSISDGG
jgi:hypothetical protein